MIENTRYWIVGATHYYHKRSEARVKEEKSIYTEWLEADFNGKKDDFVLLFVEGEGVISEGKIDTFLDGEEGSKIVLNEIEPFETILSQDEFSDSFSEIYDQLVITGVEPLDKETYKSIIRAIQDKKDKKVEDATKVFEQIEQDQQSSPEYCILDATPFFDRAPLSSMLDQLRLTPKDVTGNLNDASGRNILLFSESKGIIGEWEVVSDNVGAKMPSLQIERIEQFEPAFSIDDMEKVNWEFYKQLKKDGAVILSEREAIPLLTAIRNKMVHAGTGPKPADDEEGQDIKQEVSAELDLDVNIGTKTSIDVTSKIWLFRASIHHDNFEKDLSVGTVLHLTGKPNSGSIKEDDIAILWQRKVGIYGWGTVSEIKNTSHTASRNIDVTCKERYKKPIGLNEVYKVIDEEKNAHLGNESDPTRELGIPELTVFNELFEAAGERAFRIPPPTDSLSASQIEAFILNDSPATVDMLGYKPIVDSLVSFIQNEKTKPPLTIGIKAKWGVGKSSIMKMVRCGIGHNLPEKEHKECFGKEEEKENAEKKVEAQNIDSGQQEERLGLIEFLNFINDPKQEIILDSKKESESESEKEMKPDKGKRLTVWFNAWRYQNKEQIWAGLAHHIVEQIGMQFPEKERHKLWLKFNLKRQDIAAVKYKIYRSLLGLFLKDSKEILGILVSVTPFILWYLPKEFYPFIYACLLFLFYKLVKTSGAWEALLPDDSELKSSGLLSPPNYEKKLGFLHLVEEDIKELCDIAKVSKEKPIVVFIDDLDRCEPRNVAEVIEALNYFISGGSPHFIFILGMDPEVVSASLEEANKEVYLHMKRLRYIEPREEVGKKFMEKIIQMPISIPKPDEKKIKAMIQSMDQKLETDKDTPENGGTTDTGHSGPFDGQTPEDEKAKKSADDYKEYIKSAFSHVYIKGEIANKWKELFDEKEKKVVDYTISVDAMQNIIDEEFKDRKTEQNKLIDEYSKVIEDYTDIIGLDNPREVKRFWNQMRYYKDLKQRNDTAWQEGDTPIPEMSTIGKYVAIMTKFSALIKQMRKPKGAAVANGERSLKDIFNILGTEKKLKEVLNKPEIQKLNIDEKKLNAILDGDGTLENLNEYFFGE